MTRRCLRLCLCSCALALLTLGGCLLDNTLLEVTRTRIDSSGGEAKSPDGKVVLRFAKGSVTQATEITIEARREEKHPGQVGLVYEFGPDGLTFEAPVEVRFQMDGPVDTGFVVAQIDGDRIRPLAGSTLSETGDVVTAGLRHFSRYAVFDLGGPCENRACGESCTVTAADGTSLTGYCDAQGRCGFLCEPNGSDGGCDLVAPDCSDDVYDPCAGLSCGDICRLCPPDDPTCVETTEVKVCNEHGECTSLYPQCTEPGTCSSDADCAEGEVCEEGFCRPGPCICADGSLCDENGQCGSNGGPCAGKVCGDLCDPCEGDPNADGCITVISFCQADGACRPERPICEGPGECDENGLCPDGRPCNPDGTCEDLSCSDDSACPPGTACIGGLCQPCDVATGRCGPLECTSDADCYRGETCVDGWCLPACDPTLGMPCVDPCQSDADCAPGEVCGSDGLCHPACDPMTGANCSCSNDTDCPLGFVCDPRGECVPGCDSSTGMPCVAECTSDADCGPGEVCGSDGICHPACDPMTGANCGCSDDSDCPLGFVCDPMGGQCVPGCDPNQGMPCVEPCQSDADCAPGEVCGTDGLCRPACDPSTGQACACASDADCPAGQSCTMGVCG